MYICTDPPIQVRNHCRIHKYGGHIHGRKWIFCPLAAVPNQGTVPSQRCPSIPEPQPLLDEKQNPSSASRNPNLYPNSISPYLSLFPSYMAAYNSASPKLTKWNPSFSRLFRIPNLHVYFFMTTTNLKSSINNEGLKEVTVRNLN